MNDDRQILTKPPLHTNQFDPDQDCSTTSFPKKDGTLCDT